MKTLHSSRFVSVLALTLAACGGEDDSASVGSLMTAEAPAAPTTPAPTEASTESQTAPEAVETGTEPSVETNNPPAQSAGEDLATAELAWRACGQFQDRNLECAEVTVPIDYAQPEGEQISIALRRVLANPNEPYRGSLLFNPGGPGGEGIELAMLFFEIGLFDLIAPGYDIVGFDPRGVANSGERGCGIDAPNLYPGAAPSETEANATLQDYVDLYRTVGERCEREWGTLFHHIGSNNVVRDMEEIRKALHEPTLNFFGGSYGTRLGALYAHAYPETTGRMVLDAAAHPRQSLIQLVRGQFLEAVRLHEVLLSACESGALTCPPDARLLFDAAVENARQRGLEAEFVGAWQSILAQFDAPAVLTGALASEAADPGGEWILSFLGGGASDGGSGLVALIGVNCIDDNFEPPTPEQLESLRAEFEQVSPVFAGSVNAATACAGWPTRRDPVPLPTALDAPPLLVIGGTADPRTPYAWSQAMTEALGNATLLTSNHWGHVAVTNGGDCVRLAVRAYLTSGSLPASGAVCDL